MCGICGLVTRDPGNDEPVRRMAAHLAHRGPDSSGHVALPAGLWFGHRRLSIIDTSSAGHQPMESHDGRYVITYNGEIYNYVELRDQLRRAGDCTIWDGGSDTEVLLEAIRAWGLTDTLIKCNGMFALALWDRKERTLALARDRMGEKPLYFGWIDRCFAFASELKAFTAIPGWSPVASLRGMGTYALQGYVSGMQSAVSGVFRLPPASTLVIGEDQLRRPLDEVELEDKIAYFWNIADIATNAARDTTYEDSIGELEILLGDSVAKRMVADVPVGSFLSGGIDSSLITALMQEHSSQPVRTFSIGFDAHGFNEAPHAMSVAKHLGTTHTELYVTEQDVSELVPRLGFMFDEPFADQSQIPTLMVSSLARREVSVALSGDGGDELFAGYARYHSITRLWELISKVPMHLRPALSPMLVAAGFAADPLKYLNSSLPGSLKRLGARLKSPDIDSIRAAFIGGTGSNHLLQFPAIAAANRASAPGQVQDPLRRLQYGDQVDYLPDDILFKVDRASMAYGLETRVPLLDHRLVEFSWSLNRDALVDGKRSKRILRDLLSRHVPETLTDRPKQGFTPPMGEWLRGPLREWAEWQIAEISLGAIPAINAPAVAALWQQHQSRRVDASGQLWRVFMLSSWSRDMRIGW